MEHSPIPDNDNMQIEFKNKQPVELVDYTLSMLALSNEYSRMLTRQYGSGVSGAVKVYVKEVRTGSIFTEIVAASAGVVPAVLPHLEHATTLMEYVKSLKKSYDYLSGKDAEPVELDRQSLSNLSSIVEPVAKDNGSQLNIVTNNTYNAPVYKLGIDSVEANAIQNGISRILESKELPVTGIHYKVVLQLHQARSTINNHTIDRGIIERISRAPVKLAMDDTIKAAIIHGDDNPFRMGYLVDVDVQTVNNKPQLYKILNLWQKFPLDSYETRPLDFEE